MYYVLCREVSSLEGSKCIMSFVERFIVYRVLILGETTIRGSTVHQNEQYLIPPNPTCVYACMYLHTCVSKV